MLIVKSCVAIPCLILIINKIVMIGKIKLTLSFYDHIIGVFFNGISKKAVEITSKLPLTTFLDIFIRLLFLSQISLSIRFITLIMVKSLLLTFEYKGYTENYR